ncbi:NUDIX domain-containing protein [Phycicoccus endophyticus]|uniref:NUDIX domain-containing protein n=1 Tax=Phycicoccus endophyticus TaxID=1690220 RepID=A0A7G9QZL6_9MICO|nr:NUDIX domain-containing protein [Phycicoccus endophyticus]NHI19978.1 NUDIX domain-containing protein [Phycicoccus endophyticus]QNN48791.1 NUDIX domain-containing protein [Phycicoccus endophyticus]GGL42909.1 NUDIX hydrolase [Phycicoccus endophyticus]
MATPEFILRLRASVGHELLWLPGVTAVVLDGERVLLVRRSDDGRWTPVTGICDPGEHPARTAMRECLEETGVRCAVELLAWVDVTGVVEYPNGDRSQYVDHTFRCRYVGGEAHVADDESSDVAWFPLDGLPEMDADHLERVRTAVSHEGPSRLTP